MSDRESNPPMIEQDGVDIQFVQNKGSHIGGDVSLAGAEYNSSAGDTNNDLRSRIKQKNVKVIFKNSGEVKGKLDAKGVKISSQSKDTPTDGKVHDVSAYTSCTGFRVKSSNCIVVLTVVILIGLVAIIMYYMYLNKDH